MSTELIKTEEVSNIIITFPAIMDRNNKSLAACQNAGKTFLDTIEAEGMNEALDQETAEYLAKVKELITKMESRRQPLTQLFDKIRSLFTSQEKSIDPKNSLTIPGRLVVKRNEYAAWKHQQEQKRKQEAEKLANIEREKASYKRSIEEAIYRTFNAYLSQRSAELTSVFSGMTLITYERDTNRILLFSTEYPKVQFDSLLSIETTTYYLSGDEKRSIRSSVFAGKHEELSNLLNNAIKEIKQSYSDQFLSMQHELKEIEELSKTNAEAARQAEEQRRRREEEEKARHAEEFRRQEATKMQQAAAAEQAEAMQSLFATASASVSAPPTNAKIKEKIKVLHSAGFLEIYQMWWINEGQSLSIEDLEKVHKKMITFCEKQANGKDPQHINSAYIRYDEEIKAK